MNLSRAQFATLIALNASEKTKYGAKTRNLPAAKLKAGTLGILCQLGLVNVDQGEASLTPAGRQVAEANSPPKSAEPNHEDD